MANAFDVYLYLCTYVYLIVQKQIKKLQFLQELCTILKNVKSSLLIDESNQIQNEKFLNILVKFFWEGRVHTRFYQSVIVNKATAHNIVSALCESLQKDGIPWSNVIQLMTDSPHVMRGKKSGVLARVKQEHAPNIVDVGGCSLHHVANAVSHATSALGDEVENFALDVFAFFKHRSGLLKDFRGMQTILDLPTHRILRFVSTRWLSVLPVVERLLEQLPALRVFF